MAPLCDGGYHNAAKQDPDPVSPIPESAPQREVNIPSIAEFADNQCIHDMAFFPALVDQCELVVQDSTEVGDFYFGLWWYLGKQC